jgi:4-hydroxy-tetrahydrodipicolinate synthase
LVRESPWGSLIVALVTPFNQDGSVDYEKAAKLAQKLVSQGVDGVLVSGTTGESPTLTKEEKLRLLATVRESLSPETLVWAGTSGYNTKESVSLTKLAEATGADGILAVTPYYNKPSQEGLYAHMRAVASETSLPVMLYNVPSRTGVNLLPETVLRLAEIQNIVAIKEASGNIDQSSYILANCPQRFYVYSGDDSLTLPILSVGGSGVVSVAAHLVAHDLKSMIYSFHKGDIETARALHLRLYELFKVLFITSNPVPVKIALEICGVPVGGFRLPLCPPTERERNEISRVLSELRLAGDPDIR